MSFAFTLGTFFRVIWVNIETLNEAPHEVHSYLTNLRTELLEEKASLKVMRKQIRKHWRTAEKRTNHGTVEVGIEMDEVTLRTMSDAIRHLIRQFKDIEKPFLEPGEHGISDELNHRKRRRRDESGSPYYEHSAYASPPEKAYAGARNRSRSRNNHDRQYNDRDEGDEEKYWAQRTQYARYSLKKRFIWLYKKPQAQQLFGTLSRVQIRRIARQVGGLSWLVHEYGKDTQETGQIIRRIDERMSRFVGVRRVNDEGSG